MNPSLAALFLGLTAGLMGSFESHTGISAIISQLAALPIILLGLMARPSLVFMGATLAVFVCYTLTGYLTSVLFVLGAVVPGALLASYLKHKWHMGETTGKIKSDDWGNIPAVVAIIATLAAIARLVAIAGSVEGFKVAIRPSLDTVVSELTANYQNSSALFNQLDNMQLAQILADTLPLTEGLRITLMLLLAIWISHRVYPVMLSKMNMPGLGGGGISRLRFASFRANWIAGSIAAISLLSVGIINGEVANWLLILATCLGGVLAISALSLVHLAAPKTAPSRNIVIGLAYIGLLFAYKLYYFAGLIDSLFALRKRWL